MIDWNVIIKTLWHTALQFGASFGTALLANQSYKMAIAAGLVAVGTGQYALYQHKPTQ